MKSFRLATLCVFLLAAFYAKCQVIWPNSFANHSYNVENDSSADLVWRPSVRTAHIDKGFDLLDLESITYYNSNYPRSWNDGPVWVGRGLTQEIRFGFRLASQSISLTIAPMVYWSQNRSYALADIDNQKDGFNYLFRKMQGSSADIDFVQRFGNDAFSQFHLGQSSLDFKMGKLSAGLSTQNFSLGPSTVNHLIMSTSGAGFPFAYFTTDKLKLKIKNVELGKVQPLLYYGLLRESDYFDSDTRNNNRYINGLSVAYELPRINNLVIGLNRVMYKSTQFFDAADLYSLIHIADDGIELSSAGDTLQNTGNDTFDQLASLFIEWKLLKSGARFYFELGKNDFDGTFRKTALEFEHNTLYTLGFEKVWDDAHSRKCLLSYERTQLTFNKNYIYRPTNSAYTHTVNKQGYTHQGQLLGPAIGPGSISDFLGFRLFDDKKTLAFSLQRIKFDEDYFITQLENTPDKTFLHDVEYSLGIDFFKHHGQIYWGIRSLLSYRYNTYFVQENDLSNIHLQVHIGYQFGD